MFTLLVHAFLGGDQQGEFVHLGGFVRQHAKIIGCIIPAILGSQCLAAETSYFAVRGPDALNIRSGPDVRYEKVGEIPPLTTGVQNLGCTSDGYVWCRVRFGIWEGWSSARYLTEYKVPSGAAPVDVSVLAGVYEGCREAAGGSLFQQDECNSQLTRIEDHANSGGLPASEWRSQVEDNVSERLSGGTSGSGVTRWDAPESAPPKQASSPPLNFAGRKNVGASEIDRLTSYSVIMGRGLGCGVAYEPTLLRVIAWIASTFGTESERMNAVFGLGMQHHAHQQRAGNSPDDCATVRASFNKMPWP